MNKKLKIGVVGLGLIGELHARIISELPNSELIAVADIDQNRAKNIGKKYSCEYYTDCQTMFQKADIQAVSICTPDQFHVKNSFDASNAGLDILLEKPIATTAKDAANIISMAEKNGIRIMVAHLLHFDPRYAILRDSIKSGKLGSPIHMSLRRTNSKSNARRLNGDVSIFHFIGVHDFEMMCSCAGSSPTRVFSQSVSKINQDIGCEDSVFTIINFADGSIGSIELCWALPDNSSLGINSFFEYAGTNGVGYVRIMDQGVNIITEKHNEFPDTLYWPQYNGGLMGDLKQELQHFVTATLEGSPYITEIQTAVLAVRVIEGCLKSIATGLPVNIEPN